MVAQGSDLVQKNKKKRKSKLGQKSYIGYLFLIPWLLGLLFFRVGPMGASLYFSLNHFDMLTVPSFIGFENYMNLFSDQRFLNSVRTTFTFVFLSVPLQLTFSLLVAVLLKRNRKGVRVYRAIYYLPSLFGGSVAVAILWRQLFNQTGLLNRFLELFGIEGRNWIASPDTALYTLIVLAIWQFGASMVIFLAALKQIPDDYYEAASIDGVRKWHQFTKITLPLLTPIIFFNLIMQIINAFQSFTSAFIVSGGTGGPLDSTLFYSLYLFIVAFGQFRMGYAATMAWVLLIIIGLVTGVIFMTSKFWVFYEDK
jgi:multiple sugar transport system permease protein